jgi:hypothetical protein
MRVRQAVVGVSRIADGALMGPHIAAKANKLRLYQRTKAPLR